VPTLRPSTAVMSVVSSCVFASVPFCSLLSLLSSLPPSCPRTRPKDAKTRSTWTGSRQTIIGFPKRRGGFEPLVR
jgi:hypothetical protein